MRMTTMYKLNAVKGVAMAVLVVALASTQAGAAIIATDDVEDAANYTEVGNASFGTKASPDNGLTAIAGSSFVAVTSGSGNPRSGTVTHNAGFGAGTLVAAGKYTLTVSAGEGNLTRIAFNTFNPFLQTTAGGTELPGGVETTSWVAPAAPATTDEQWQSIVVEYTVPVGDALIGQEFTWGFVFDKPDVAPFKGVKFYAGIDALSVDFVAVPEPASLMLVGVGVLGIAAMRRMRVA